MTKLICLILAVVVAAAGYSLWGGRNRATPPKRPPPAASHGFSNTEADSFWVIVNKQQPLTPKNYVPPDLVTPKVKLRSNITDEESKLRYAAAQALQTMAAAAQKAGLELSLESGYRSYNLQQKLHDSYVALQGDETANSYSALPGYSEHQTGLAVDVGGAYNPACNVQPCFETTPEAAWLAANADKFGFIVRYPKGQQQTTGYAYEPWHLRYVGIYLAHQLKIKNITVLEDYFRQR